MSQSTRVFWCQGSLKPVLNSHFDLISSKSMLIRFKHYPGARFAFSRSIVLNIVNGYAHQLWCSRHTCQSKVGTAHSSFHSSAVMCAACPCRDPGTPLLSDNIVGTRLPASEMLACFISFSAKAVENTRDETSY